MSSRKKYIGNIGSDEYLDESSKENRLSGYDTASQDKPNVMDAYSLAYVGVVAGVAGEPGELGPIRDANLYKTLGFPCY